MAQVQMVVSGREVYASTEIALGQQLWLQTWCDIHRDELKPGTTAIETKATIPEETYALDDPPNPQGIVGRAEINFSITVVGQSDNPERLDVLSRDVINQLSSNEVMGWVSTGT